MMKYKDYVAKVEFDGDGGVFFGRVLNLRDVLTFEATSVKGLERAFKDTIEDYLDFCRERGDDPERPFTGNLRVRMDPELHRRAAALAESQGLSLNKYIIHALETTVKQEG